MRNDGEDSFLCRLEECDDNNLLDGDGCSKKCRMETGFNCKGESISVSVVKISRLGKSRANFYVKANITRLKKVEVEWIKFVILFAELNIRIDIEEGGSSPVEKWHMMSLEIKHIWSLQTEIHAFIYIQSRELSWSDLTHIKMAFTTFHDWKSPSHWVSPNWFQNLFYNKIFVGFLCTVTGGIFALERI